LYSPRKVVSMKFLGFRGMGVLSPILQRPRPGHRFVESRFDLVAWFQGIV
jgi:hypothetical protein